MPDFLRNCQRVSKVAAPFKIPCSTVLEFQSAHILTTSCFSSGCKVIARYGFKHNF